MANNNRNKSKSRADDPDPVDSPLTSLASTSLNPPPKDDTIVQSTDTLRTIISASEAYSVATPTTLSKSLIYPTDSPVSRSPPHTAKREDNESDGDGPRPSFNQKHFMKDPMALHRSIHTSVELLKFNGENFTAWQQQLDTTLDFVFLTDRFSEKAHWSKLSAEHEPSVTLLLQGSVEPLLFKSDFYASEQQDSNAELIAQFQDFFLEVSQQNLSLDELLGLVLQSVVKPPIGVDENSFRNNLNHRLNTSTPAPLLDTVCQEIAQVEGELHTGTSSNPILINRLQPSGRPHQKAKSSNPGGINTSFGHKALSNALAFQGQKPSTALMAAKGDTCKYCEIKGHWASTCRRFARDLRDGKIDLAKLAEYAKDPQFNLNPSVVKVRAVDLNATPDDTVLVDSGASACDHLHQKCLSQPQHSLCHPITRDVGDVRPTTGLRQGLYHVSGRMFPRWISSFGEGLGLLQRAPEDFIHSANAIFPDYQALPVSGIKTSKNDISFLLNNLVLGEEPTDTEAAVQQQAIDSLLTRPDIAVPDNIHQAFSSPESSEWRKAAELN
ncbi:hypothetical protein KEM48_006516 [Puccinia striiformis f. sp. tritici PST-130]|nr:hypothetical protein KEM48_006516 [Puccinia striiformis f. sp. tritici PST-130]